MEKADEGYKSDIYFVLSGSVDVLKSISVVLLLSIIYPEEFKYLALNIDVMTAVLSFVTPWLFAFIQLSKISPEAAYRRCVSALVLVAATLMAAYLALSVVAFGEDLLSHGLVVFIMLRTASVGLLVFSAINQSRLMLLGSGAFVFWLQLGTWAATTSVYLIIWALNIEFSFVYVGASLLLIDITVFCLSYSLIRRKVSSKLRLKPSMSFSIRIRKILIPEALTVASIGLSALLISLSVYAISPDEYSVFRVPFAFQMACWIICSRAAVLVMRKYSSYCSGLLGGSFMYCFKTTWFVPVLLVLVALVMGGGMPGHNAKLCIIALSYYPAMVMVIALNGAFRLLSLNGLIAKANQLMFVFFFIPASALIAWHYIGIEYVIHVVGVSYCIRFIVLMALYYKQGVFRESGCTI